MIKYLIINVTIVTFERYIQRMTGEELKESRKRAKLTQDELANKLDIQREMIARWETKGGISKVYQKILTTFFKQKQP